MRAVKEFIPVVEFYRGRIPTLPAPRNRGWQRGGLCPFHDDNHVGNFHVNLVSGAFKCFACGASGGDIIAFEQRRTGEEFKTVLARLAEEFRHG